MGFFWFKKSERSIKVKPKEKQKENVVVEAKRKRKGVFDIRLNH